MIAQAVHNFWNLPSGKQFQIIDHILVDDPAATCACGRLFVDLRAFFGDDFSTHISECPACHKLTLHNGEESSHCINCGYWSGIDAVGNIIEGNWFTGEQRTIRDMDQQWLEAYEKSHEVYYPE